MTSELWNVMTRSRGGTVSLLKNLTEDEARGLMQRLGHQENPYSHHAISCRVARDIILPALPDGEHSVPYLGTVHKRGGGSQYSHGFGYTTHANQLDAGELLQVECWTTGETKLEVWPKPAGYDEQYAIAVQAAKEWLTRTEVARVAVDRTNKDLEAKRGHR
jgi:hypothetical protein